MIEILYRQATRFNPPSFKRLFEQVDQNSDGVIDYLEVERMVRKTLLIPTAKVSDEAIREFFLEIDRNRDGKIELDEWRRFMERMAREVAHSFRSVESPEDATPPWLRPKSYDELVAECRARKVIGGFTSISREGPLLPLRPEARKSTGLPFPSPSTVLRRDVRKNVAMK
jgi:hypothetical protein